MPHRAPSIVNTSSLCLLSYKTLYNDIVVNYFPIIASVIFCIYISIFYFPIDLSQGGGRLPHKIDGDTHQELKEIPKGPAGGGGGAWEGRHVSMPMCGIQNHLPSYKERY